MDNTNQGPRSSNDDERDALNDRMDALIPVPEEPAGERSSVADQIDLLLPRPTDHPDAEDDASTREELETDTSVDDVDDIVSFERESAKEEPSLDEPVDDDHEPVNTDSSFYTSSYTTSSEPESTNVTSDEQPTPPADACPACGEHTGGHHYCPHCGAELRPASGLAAALAPLLTWSKSPIIRGTLTVGGILILVSLLSDSGLGALVIAAILGAVVIMLRLYQHLQPLSKTELIAAAVLALLGLTAGVPLSWLAANTVNNSWFDTGILNYGAAGYGGEFSATAGSAPWQVWLIVGVLLPIVVVVAITAVTFVARVALSLNTRERTGMFLAAAAASGFVVASAIIFYQPLSQHPAPHISTSQWTLAILGISVIRPLVLILSGAMLGAVAFRYLRTMDPGTVIMPAIVAIAIPIGFGLVSMAAQSAGAWAEFLVGVVFAIVASWVYQRFLNLTAHVTLDRSAT